MSYQAQNKKATQPATKRMVPLTAQSRYKKETTGKRIAVELETHPNATQPTLGIKQPPKVAELNRSTTQYPGKITEKRAEKRAEKMAEKMAEKRAEKRAEKSVEKRVVMSDSQENGLTVSEMVSELRKSMAQNDGDKVNAWLDTLTKIKKPDDPYLLNMRAYWHMTRQEYREAEIYLNQVLLGNATDLEAGLNLAIVEADTNRREKAQQRLHALSQHYPNESRLQYILNNLR